jgi:hypothetical protein
MNLYSRLFLHLLICIPLSTAIYHLLNFKIPGEIYGWLVISFVTPIITSLLSTSTWLNAIEHTLVYSHSWDQDINGSELIEWLSIYMMKHKVWSYGHLTKVINNKKSIWWNDDDCKTRPQIFELPSGRIIFSYNGSYLMGSYPYPSVQHLEYRKEISHKITVQSLKDINWKTFIEDVRDYYYDHLEANKMSLYKVNNRYHPHGHSIRQVIPIRNNPSIEICFGDPDKENVWNIITNFLDSKTRNHFKSLSQPYRTSFLIHGLPGTGKTEMLFQIASRMWKDHRKPIYIINPRGMTDNALEDVIDEIQSGFVLVNEWDLVINKSDKNNGDTDDDKYKDTVDYPSIKAWLDILDQAQGEIIFWFTTNNYDELAKVNDGALIRDCRIDHRIEFKPMKHHHARKALKYFIKDKDCEIEALSDDKLENLTIAKIIKHLKYLLPLDQINQSD